MLARYPHFILGMIGTRVALGARFWPARFSGGKGMPAVAGVATANAAVREFAAGIVTANTGFFCHAGRKAMEPGIGFHHGYSIGMQTLLKLAHLFLMAFSAHGRAHLAFDFEYLAVVAAMAAGAADALLRMKTAAPGVHHFAMGFGVAIYTILVGA